MPKAPRPARKRPDWTPGPWRYDSAAGAVRTGGPAPRTLAGLRAAGGDRRPAQETEPDGRLKTGAPWLAETLGALCDASAALLDAVDRVAAVGDGDAPNDVPPDDGQCGDLARALRLARKRRHSPTPTSLP
jgi:hypothetical protein